MQRRNYHKNFAFSYILLATSPIPAIPSTVVHLQVSQQQQGFHAPLVLLDCVQAGLPRLPARSICEQQTTDLSEAAGLAVTDAYRFKGSDRRGLTAAQLSCELDFRRGIRCEVHHPPLPSSPSNSLPSVRFSLSFCN